MANEAEVVEPEVKDVLSPEQEDAAFSEGFSPQAPTATPDAEEPEAIPGETPPSEEPAPQEPAPEPPKPVFKEDLDAALNALRAESKAHGDKLGGMLGSLKQAVELIRTQTPSGQPVELTLDDIPEDMREEYPDLSDKMLRAMLGMAQKMRGTAAPAEPVKEVPPISTIDIESIKTATREETLRQVHMDLVADAYPDWEEIVHSEAYRGWLEKQPEAERNKIANSWNSTVVKGSIRSFQESLKPVTPPPSTRKEVLAAAVTPKGAGGAHVSRPLSEDEEFAAGFAGG